MEDEGSINPNPPRILLLQGPVGPFFRILGQELRQRGFAVDHILFNLGDLLYAGWRNTTIFRKSNNDWHLWMESAFAEKRYDAVVLFGCQRDRHEIARKVAKEYEVPLLSLEEGYLRPGYISAEPGGNNNHSPLAKLPADEYAHKPDTPRPKRTKGRGHKTMIKLGAWYYIARALGYLWFRRAHHHKTRYAVPESLLWIRNFYRMRTRNEKNKAIIDHLIKDRAGKYFLVPLQVRDDLQLLNCGRGWNNVSLVEATIESFCKHAPKDHVLVIKAHPMERGHTADDKLIRQKAAEHKCSGRVFFLDDGVMGSLTRASAGMVTVNSTSGLSALLHTVPLAVLGDAMFAHPNLVTRIDRIDQLDDFWCNSKAAPKKIAHNFRSHIVTRALLPGDYYHVEDRLTASKHVAERLLRLLDTGQ